MVPISGFPGDGATVAVLALGQTSPGAVRWHGGQWVMPYVVSPGSVLQNVSCDIWNPTTSAPASVLVEVVSSNGQVLGSATAPASTTAVIRAWPFVGAHPVIDGEQLVVRLSAKDATTGAWTTGAQDTTVIGCAVDETMARTDLYSIGFAIPGPGAQVFPGSASTNTSLGLNTSTASSNLPLRVESGRTLAAWSIRVIKNSTAGTISARLWRAVAGSGAAVQVGTTQTLSAQSVANVGQSGLSEPIATTASYFIEVQGGGSSGDFIGDYQATVH